MELDPEHPQGEVADVRATQDSRQGQAGVRAHSQEALGGRGH